MIKSDVTIVGGGIVGMAAALVLAQNDYQVYLIESKSHSKINETSFDNRTLVINNASKCFWKNLNIWNQLTSYLNPIDSVHVSQKGKFGTCTFDSTEFDQNPLANVIEAQKLLDLLLESVKNNSNIEYLSPCNFLGFNSEPESITVNVESENKAIMTIQSKLVLAADGAQSKIRGDLGLDYKHKDFGLKAVIANITTEQKHQNRAFERLTSIGPTAILPYKNNRCGFVWTMKSKDAKDILIKNDQEFIQLAQEQFGYRLGKIVKVGKRVSYPLHQIQVPLQAKDRVILIGNAAHTLSPVSAQGLNLSIRDLSRLIDALNESTDIGSTNTINNYLKSIEYDHLSTFRYTSDLMGWFKIEEPLVNIIRSFAIFGINQFAPVKNNIYQRVSGFKGLIPTMLRENNEFL